MNLQQLRYFIVLAEELHFQRAAIRIPCAQSSLSAQILSLEREIGEPLLVRHPRYCELTAAGSRLYLEALRLIHAAERAIDVARGDVTRLRQRLRIGVPEEGIQSLMDVLLAAYRISHPAVEVIVETCEWSAMDDLATARDPAFDAVLWGSDTPLDGLVGYPVYREQLILLVSDRSRFADLTEIDPMEVLDEPMIDIGEFMRRAGKPHYLTSLRNGEAPRYSSIPFDDMEAVLVAVANGYGCVAPTIGSLLLLPTIGVHSLRLSKPLYAAVGTLIRSDERRPHVLDFATMGTEIGRSLFGLIPEAVSPDLPLRPVTDPKHQ